MFSLFNQVWMLSSCLVTVQLDLQRGLTRLHGVVSTKRETRCLTNSNQLEDIASGLQRAAGPKSLTFADMGQNL